MFGMNNINNKNRCDDENESIASHFIARKSMQEILYENGFKALNMPYLDSEMDVHDVIRIAGYEREYKHTNFISWANLRGLKLPLSFKTMFNRHLLVRGRVRDLGFNASKFCAPFGYCMVVKSEDSSLSIQSMAVHPTYRCLGIGRAMVLYVLSMAGNEKVQCLVREDDTNTINFLVKCKVFNKTSSDSIWISGLRPGQGDFIPAVLFVVTHSAECLNAARRDHGIRL